MQRTNCWVKYALLAIVIAASAVSSSAQQRMHDKDVTAAMTNLNEDAKKFRRAFDSAVSKSHVRKTSQEKDAKALSQQFEQQTGGMLSQFKKSKRADNLPAVLSAAEKLEKSADSAGIAAQLAPLWTPIRANLDKLSAEFNIPK